MEEVRTQCYLVEANDTGKTRRTLIKEYRSGDRNKDESPSDYYSFRGICYQHSNSSSYRTYSDSNFAEQRNSVAYRLYSSSDISHLEGELLTLVDAMLNDKTQRDAFKSLLKRTLWKNNQSLEDEVSAMCKVAQDVGKVVKVG